MSIRKRFPILLLTLAMAEGIAPGCAAAHAANDSASPEETPGEKTNNVKIRIQLDKKTLTATLADNATSRDFVSLLPLTLTLKNYASTEKIYYLARKLSTEGRAGRLQSRCWRHHLLCAVGKSGDLLQGLWLLRRPARSTFDTASSVTYHYQS